MYKRVVTKIINILFAPIKKVIFGEIDGYTQHMMKNDPEINRLRKKSDRLDKELDDLVDREYDGKEPDWLKIARRR